MIIDRDIARAKVEGHIANVGRSLDALPFEQIVDLVALLRSRCIEGRAVYIAGNGGSASTASHMACDLGKNVVKDQGQAGSSRFRVTALVDNTAWMTAIANDDGYEWVFAKQLEALAEPDDVLIVISASGNSPNVVEAVRSARAMGVTTVGILGFGGGILKDLVDLSVVVAGNEYGPVEDVHLVLNHAIAESLRATLCS